MSGALIPADVEALVAEAFERRRIVTRTRKGKPTDGFLAACDAVVAERAASVAVAQKWAEASSDTIRLHCGEATAGEIRTAKALVGLVLAALGHRKITEVEV